MLEHWKLTVLLFLLVEFTVILNGEVLPFFNWDRTNTKFRHNLCGNGSHAHIFVKSYDRMNIVCPSAALPVSVVPETIPQDELYENLWMVSKKEFEDCKVDRKRKQQRKSKLLMKCDEPSSSRIKFYQLAFKPGSGSSAALVFESDKTYYFIATSNGHVSSLMNMAGGGCSTHTMKLAITVCGGSCFGNCADLCCTKPTTPPKPPVPTSAAVRSTKAAQPSTVTERSTGRMVPITKSEVPGGFTDSNHVEGSGVPPVRFNSPVNNQARAGVGNPKGIQGTDPEKDELKDSKEKMPWPHFGYGVGCGVVIMLLIVFIGWAVCRRRTRDEKSRQGSENNAGNLHYDRSDIMKPYTADGIQEPTLYKRLESTGSTGSGGDTPPSYPDSPNGTLDSNGQLVPVVIPIRNGHIRSSRLPLLSNSSKDTCVPV